jgi:hypothetical protein
MMHALHEKIEKTLSSHCMGSEQVMGGHWLSFCCSIVTFASSCDKRWSTQRLFLTVYEVTCTCFCILLY